MAFTCSIASYADPARSRNSAGAPYLRREGIGKRLMTDALARVASIARNAGTFARTLDAIDETAAGYYESQFDFHRFTDGGLKMFLAVPTILALDLPSPADA